MTRQVCIRQIAVQRLVIVDGKVLVTGSGRAEEHLADTESLKKEQEEGIQRSDQNASPEGNFVAREQMDGDGRTDHLLQTATSPLGYMFWSF